MDFDFGDLPELPDFDFDVAVAESPKSEPVVIEPELPESDETRRILAEIAVLTEDLGRGESTLGAVESEIKTIEKERARIQAMLTEIANKLFDKRQLRKNIVANIAATEKEIEQLRRALALEYDRLLMILETKGKLAEIESATAGYAWNKSAYSHQLLAAKGLAAAKRGILADGPGLGKTFTSMMWADMVGSKKLLILAPANLTNSYIRQVEKFASHRKCYSIQGHLKAVRNHLFDIIIGIKDQPLTIVMNYDLIDEEGVVDKIIACGFDSIIMDEAHSFKEVRTALFKGLNKVMFAENCCPLCSAETITTGALDVCTVCGWNSVSGDRDYDFGDRNSIKNVLCMSGTTVLNKPQDLWPLLHFMLPGVFDSVRDFQRDYCLQDLYRPGRWTWKNGALVLLMGQLRGRYVSRTIDDPQVDITLPPQVVEPIYIPRDVVKFQYPDQFRVMEEVRKNAQIILNSGESMRMDGVLAAITRERQASVCPAGIKLKDQFGSVVFSVADDVTESAKVDVVVDHIQKNVANGERIVVFSQFTGPLEYTRDKLEALGIRAAIYNGATSKNVREIIEVDFDRMFCEAEGYEVKFDVVLCNYATGGQGLNLNAAVRTYTMDSEWNPGMRDQAYFRTKRIGQTEPTFVHPIIITPGIDEWLEEIIKEKALVVQGFESEASDISAAYIQSLMES